ncbi:MAG: type II toxin-antitoxin system ParD family antitoxin [Sphingomonadaceae bacterium]|nr:type II toxin-antitoxin system ParD family antitoxin [Sphingomonadaceae bacterium]
MSEMTVTVPPALEDYLRERVAAGDFVDPGEYVRDLIRADQRSLADLRAQIDEGLASGDSDRTVDEIFDEVIARRRNA